MKNWFRNKNDKKNEELDEKIRASTELVLKVANNTITLADELTDSLRNRIDDTYKELSATVELIPDAVFIVRRSGIIESANTQAKEMFGIDEIENDLSIFQYITYDGTTIRNVEELDKIATILNDKLTFSSEMSNLLQGKGPTGRTIILKIKVNFFKKSDEVLRYVVLLEDITERMETEKRFVELYNLTTGIMTAIPDILITIDVNGIIKSIHNPTPYLALANNQHIDKPISGNLSKPLVGFFNRFVKNPILYENKPFEFIKIIEGVEKNFVVKIIECRKDLLMLISDVTEIVQTKRHLYETEDYLKAFEQASSEAMFIHVDDKMVRWNDNLRKLFGYNDEEIQSMRPIDFVTPLDRVKYTNENNSGENTSYSILMLDKDGKHIEASVTDNVIIWNEKMARIKVIRDVGELSNVENMQQLSRERYSSITNHSMDVVFSLSSRFEIIATNNSFDDYIAGDARTVLDFIDSRDASRFLEAFQTIDEVSQTGRVTCRVKRDGIIRWLDIIIYKIGDDKGEFIEYQCVGRDVTSYIDIKK